LLPTLTTISQELKIIGKTAVDKLLKLVSKKELDEIHTVIPVSLVVRDSTK